MNRAIICLGANCSARADAIAAAAEFLATLGVIGHRSGAYLSEPEYSAPGSLYLNEVLDFASDFDYPTLHTAVKEYETAERSAHSGPTVRIDIDIVYWNGNCLRPADASARYFISGYHKIL